MRSINNVKHYWERTGKLVSLEGTTVEYRAVMVGGKRYSDISIESRKRHIPHSNRSGTWDYTSFFVLRNGEVLAEKHSLSDAKEFAEGLIDDSH